MSYYLHIHCLTTLALYYTCDSLEIPYVTCHSTFCAYFFSSFIPLIFFTLHLYSLSSFFFFLRIRRPPKSTLFPYPTLFRSGLQSRGILRLGKAPADPPTFDSSMAELWVVQEIEKSGKEDLEAYEAVFGGLMSRAQQKQDRKSTRLNSSHDQISYAVFCLKKK